MVKALIWVVILLELCFLDRSSQRRHGLALYQLLSASIQGILLQIEEANLSKHAQVCFADVQKVEMLLETYSMHIYNTYNKLQVLKEYVDDTEVTTVQLAK